MLQLITVAIPAFCAGTSVVFAVLMGRLWWQVHRYQLVLAQLVYSAWEARHMPIWIAWSEMTGISFKVIVDE